MASEIKVDTVSEKTSGSGVTIDGLLIKDGGISGDVSLIGTTPTFTIGDAGAEDAALVFDGNAQDFYIALDDSADDLLIGLGSTVGTTPAISIDENLQVKIVATTASTSATTGSFIAAGGAGIAADLSVGDDLRLISDAAVLSFGADSEITLTHEADVGLKLKHTATADDKPVVLTLQTGETDIAANDVIGAINFQAPDESTGTDAILVAAGIAAVSEGDFSSSSNATKLSFKTGASEAAAEKMSLSSAGLLTIADDLVIKDGGTIGVSSDADSITIASNGAVTFSQTPVFPDGSIAVADLDIDGATDIGAAIVDADLFIIDDGAGGTNRKVTASRIKTYAGGANSPYFLAERGSGEQSLSDDTTTKLQMENEILDSGSVYDPSTNYRFTPGVAGNYHIFAAAGLSGDAVNAFLDGSLFLYKNNSEIARAHINASDGYHRTQHMVISVLVNMDDDDYLEVFGYVNRAGSGNAKLTTNGDSYFGGYKLL